MCVNLTEKEWYRDGNTALQQRQLLEMLASSGKRESSRQQFVRRRGPWRSPNVPRRSQERGPSFCRHASTRARCHQSTSVELLRARMQGGGAGGHMQARTRLVGLQGRELACVWIVTHHEHEPPQQPAGQVVQQPAPRREAARSPKLSPARGHGRRVRLRAHSTCARCTAAP